MNRKTYFIVGAAVVALALVLYFAYSGFPPAAGVAGTLAGGDTTLAGVERADRYRAPQIDAGDVVLDNADLQLILQDPDIVEALRSDTFRTALKGALTNEDLKATLTKAIMGPVVINNPAAHADLMNALQEVVMGPAALNNPTEGAALMNALTNVLSDDALRSALARALMVPAANNADADPALTKALTNVLSDPAMTQALTSAVMKGL